MTPRELLDELRLQADSLHALICDALDVPADKRTGPDLSGLSMDEKMSMGEQVCRDLTDIAMRANPGFTLDALDSRLPLHSASRNAAMTALERVSKA